ncbi:hypothetical protein JCM11641_005255 [Rhodosporidiobolus odoratus]
MRASTSLFFLALVCAALPTFADNVATPFSAQKSNLDRCKENIYYGVEQSRSSHTVDEHYTRNEEVVEDHLIEDEVNRDTGYSDHYEHTSGHKAASDGLMTQVVWNDLQVLDVDFGQYNAATGGVEAFLERNGLMVSTYEVGGLPQAHVFVVENVDIVNGAMRRKVAANSHSGLVQSAQVETLDSSILYGTFETVAKLTPVKGICFGAFTYTDDNHEVDIEALSSYYTTGYGDSVPPGLEFTNQRLPKSKVTTNKAVPYGFDPTADFHKYSIRWAANATSFYVDDVLKHTFTENIPTVATQFLWNAWSSGDPNWTAGPPTQDSYTLIKSVHLQYTTA